MALLEALPALRHASPLHGVAHGISAHLHVNQVSFHPGFTESPLIGDLALVIVAELSPETMQETTC